MFWLVIVGIPTVAIALVGTHTVPLWAGLLIGLAAPAAMVALAQFGRE